MLTKNVKILNFSGLADFSSPTVNDVLQQVKGKEIRILKTCLTLYSVSDVTYNTYSSNTLLSADYSNIIRGNTSLNQYNYIFSGVRVNLLVNNKTVLFPDNNSYMDIIKTCNNEELNLVINDKVSTIDFKLNARFVNGSGSTITPNYVFSVFVEIL